jgi:hypothetical protein
MIAYYLHTNLPAVLLRLKEKVDALQPGGLLHDSIMSQAASSVLPAMSSRIHEQGLSADGDSIGQYSSKSLYVSVGEYPGIAVGTPAGKTGKTKFKKGKKKGQPHTSRYFEGGYAEFKTDTGLSEGGKVNLVLTGQLRDEFGVVATANGFGLGWSDPEKADRAQALETKYGKKIWALTADEKSNVVALAQKMMNDAFV